MADNKSKLEILIETASAAKSVGQLRKALKDLNSAQLEVEAGSPDFDKLVAGINETEGKIGDLNDAFKTFAGSGVERLNSSTSLLREGFAGLDLGKLEIGFKSLNKLPAALAGEIGGLTDKIKGLKLGGLSDGMKSLATGGVGTLTKSFVQLGVAILTNPIFLLAAAIGALVVLVVKFYDKVEFLRVAVEKIGQAFEFVVQKLKDFADWIGITSFAAEEAANKQIEAAKKQQDALTERYDTEIKLAEAAGKSTVDLEKKKGEAVREQIKQQIDGIVQLALINGKFSDEQLKQLEELKKAYKESLLDTKVAEIKEAKRVADEEAKTLKERNDKWKAYAEQRKKDSQALSDKIEDQQIQLIKNDEQREMAKALLDKARAEDAIKESKASAALKAAALESQEQVYLKNIADINKKFRDKEAEEKKKELEDEKALREKILADNKAIEEKALGDFQNFLGLRVEAAVDGSEEELNAKVAQLTAAADIEKMKYAEGSQERLFIEQKLGEDINELKEAYDEADKARQKQNALESLQIAQNLTSGLAGLSDLVFAIKSANTKKGSAEEEKAAKQQFKVNKALQISTAVISTITGVVNALTARWAIPEPFATIGRITNAVSVGLAGAANVAKIAATQFETKSAPSPTTGGGGGTPAAGGGGTPEFSAPQFFGLGQGAGARSAEPQRVYVLEKDITSTQDRVARVEDRATQKIE